MLLGLLFGVGLASEVDSVGDEKVEGFWELVLPLLESNAEVLGRVTGGDDSDCEALAVEDSQELKGVDVV